MTVISSSSAAMWLPSAISAQSQSANNWISQSLNTSSTSAALQDFMDTAASVADALSGAQLNQAQGLAALAIQAAKVRVSGAVQKQIDALASSSSQSTAAPSLTLYLANGSTLDVAKNTFSLPDGTILDITTGMKVDVSA
jgi:hypothetical protein